MKDFGDRSFTPGIRPDPQPSSSLPPLAFRERSFQVKNEIHADLGPANAVGSQVDPLACGRGWFPGRRALHCFTFSNQFGRTSAPMVPHFVHTIFGPNEGTVTVARKMVDARDYL